jgi:uncharacterized membrane protein YbhN (UPF0104 family)
MKKLISAGFGILISVGIIVVLFSFISFEEVISLMADMHYWPLIPSVVFIIFFYYLCVIRWLFLLPHEKERTSIVYMFDSLMVCNLENHVLPLRAGGLICR